MFGIVAYQIQQEITTQRQTSICGCQGPLNCEFKAYGTGIIKIYENDAEFQDTSIPSPQPAPFPIAPP